MSLPRSALLALRVQRGISYACLAVLGPVLVWLFRRRYRFSVHDIDHVRERYRALRAAHPGPLLICSNHLTLVDSIVQAIVLGSLWDYLKRPSALPWNLPEAKNIYHRWSWRLVCYLGRCIPVQRGGTPAQTRSTQARMQWVLNRGDAIAIFPEGARSRNGRVDDRDYSYGVGQLLNQVPDAAVMCVYLRGMRFGGFADFPTPGDRFYVQLRMLAPHSEHRGLRRARDLSGQVIACLKDMEVEYFAAREAGTLTLADTP